MPTNKETEKQYNELKKKFKLPDFKDIDLEFEISDVEETNFLLRVIIRRIAERLDFYTTMLEEILQPDTAKLYAMHESRIFEEEDKKKMFEFYRKLMILSRRSVEASLESNEKEEASFINDFMNEWEKIKSELLFYVRRIKDSWNKDADTKEDISYLG